MLSFDLRSLGFLEWHDFNLTSINKLQRDLPDKSGIYVIRDRREFGRFIKTSDIVYIGSAKDTLKGRVRKYFSSDKTRLTNVRIISWLKRYDSFQISWIVLENQANENQLEEQCRSYERSLLLQYEQDHGELPPFNRKLPPEGDTS